MNAITYKEVFPLIQSDKLWLGATANGSDMVFAVPPGATVKASDKEKAARLGYEGDYTRLGNSCWFTNVDHGRRHEPLTLMTQAENKKFSRHKEVKGVGYSNYDNYDAIEVPYTDAIPKDYPGVMGVPISFLSKYNPEQFEIVGITKTWDDDSGLKTKVYPTQIQVSTNGDESEVGKLNDGAVIKIKVAPNSTYYKVKNSMYVQVYARILLKHRSIDL